MNEVNKKREKGTRKKVPFVIVKWPKAGSPGPYFSALLVFPDGLLILKKSIKMKTKQNSKVIHEEINVMRRYSYFS